MEKLFARLKELRKEKGITQAQLGKILGVSENTIAHYENGRRWPNYYMLKKLCDFYEESADYILGFKDY